MEASNDMEELLKRIYMPSVVYFPKELFPDLTEETKKTLTEYQFFEDIAVVKVNEDIGSLRTPVNAIEIYKKEDVLEGNVFQLLEMKERLGGESFGFLLDKYLSNVKAWIYAYKWLCENFEKQIPETESNQKILFEYQSTVLENHLSKLNQRFQFNYTTTNTATALDILSKNKKMLPIDQSVYDDLIGNIKKVETNKNDKPVVEQKKQILLTEKQADDFLLTTVFNVRIG